MKLFTEVPIAPTGRKIEYKDKIFSMGSCFSMEIGNKLLNNEFRTLVNPFGTLFHPLALEESFDRIFTREHYTDSEIFEHKGLYFSWDHSTNFSRPKKDQILNEINVGIDDSNQFLNESSVFIFTLGTAWAYYLQQGEFFVSNCHKVPQKNFKKVLLSQPQIYNAIHNLIYKVYDLNPKAHIIFTISPIRHVRDGMRENNVSKGLLHMAMHRILQVFPKVTYFPSYEIVLDELRDYRFFKKDLVHVNEIGIDYIWEKFGASYFDTETLHLIEKIKNVKAAVNHKSQNPTSSEHKKFLYETLKKAENLKSIIHPQVLMQEIQTLKSKLYVS